MDESENFVGIFDSGVGGLSVLKEGLKNLPNENYIYLGDTKRVPYGEKTPEQVKTFTENAFSFFKEKKVKAGIIACNTATCYGLENCLEKFDFPILGVVSPASRDTVNTTKNNKVVLLATQGTVNSKVYENTLRNLNENIELISIGCPDLVLAVENGHIDDEYVEGIFSKYLENVSDFDFDTIILGCTHFPHARVALERLFTKEGKNISIVDPAQSTIAELKSILKEKGIISQENKKELEFFATDDIEKFKKNTYKIIGNNIKGSKFKEIDI